MDKTPLDQDTLIKRYVTGLMTDDEALDFEAFILDKPNWLTKVEQFGQTYDEALAQEWTDDVAQTLEKVKPAAESAEQQTITQGDKPAFWQRWTTLWLPVGVSFALGLSMVMVLNPASGPPLSQSTLTGFDSHNLAPVRSVGTANAEPLLVAKGTGSVRFNLPTGDNLDKTYHVAVTIDGQSLPGKDYRPGMQGKLVFSLVHPFSEGESLTITITEPGNSQWRKEYHFVVREG